MTQPPWTPAELLKTSTGYWLSSAIHAAVKLDLFTPLSESSLAVKDLSTKKGYDECGLAMLLDALVSLELLDKENDLYRCSPFAAEFLSQNSPTNLIHIIRHHHHLVDSWSKLDESVRTGKPVRSRVSHEGEKVERESFLMGMFNLAMMMAPKIVGQIDLSGHHRLLDLGGGPGTYAIHFCRENPQLKATIFDLPSTRKFAEETIKRFELSERIDFMAGDFQADPIAGSYDVAWLSHVLHGEGEQGCANMLVKTFDALEPGGLLLVHEFILDDSRDGPLFPALFSLNMLVGTPDGKAYSDAELKTILNDVGFENVFRLPIQLPNGAGIICGHKPSG